MGLSKIGDAFLKCLSHEFRLSYRFSGGIRDRVEFSVDENDEKNQNEKAEYDVVFFLQAGLSESKNSTSSVGLSAFTFFMRAMIPGRSVA